MKLKIILGWAFLLCIAFTASGQNPTQTVTTLQYYFDIDPGVGITGNGAILQVPPTSDYNQTVSIVVPGILSIGFHNLYVRTRDEFGKWSISERRLFYINTASSNETQDITAYQYYFDTDPGVGVVGNGAIVPVTQTGDYNTSVSLVVPGSLTTGFHNLYVRTKDVSGRWSLIERRLFYINTASSTETQDITAYQYFFDTDPGVGVVGNGAIVPVTQTGDYNASVSIVVPGSLTSGFHNLYLRTKDVSGRWSLIERRLFYINTASSTETQDITTYQYYFDTDPGVGVVGNGAIVPITQTGDYNTSVSIVVPGSLTTGFHNLYVRTKDVSGRWSLIERRLFYINTESSTETQDITGYQYFFDTDPGVGVVGNGAIIPVTQTDEYNSSVSIVVPGSLTSGFHNLYIRTQDVSGRWSLIERKLFYINTATSNTTHDITALEFYYDNDPGVANANPISIATTDNLESTITVDVPCLSSGVHYLYIRAMDELGRWSIIERDTVNVTSGISASIVEPAGPISICETDSIILSANLVSGISYQWLLNGNNIIGANGNTYVVDNTGIYSLKTTCGISFVTSNVVSVTSSGTIVPSISISANPGTSVCANSLVTFSASPINGGASPIYQWKKNGVDVGTNSSIYSDNSFIDRDTVSCEITSNAICVNPIVVTSNELMMSILPSVSASVSISADHGTQICPGELVTFTATPTNGGTNPSYQWKKNGINMGSNSSIFSIATLISIDTITCTMNSNEDCPDPNSAISNSIHFDFFNIPTPTITSGGSTTFCSGGFVTLDAGSFASYQWSNGSTTQTISVNSSGNYLVTVADGNNCTNVSNILTVNVNPLPSVSQSPFGDICLNSSSITLTGGSPIGGTYSGTGVSLGIFDPSIARDGMRSITYTFTDGNGCSNSAIATINVIDFQLSASSNSPVCENGILTLTANGASSYSWTGQNGFQATGSSVSIGNVAITDSGTYTVTGSVLGCSNSDFVIHVIINSLPTISITPNGLTTFCSGGSVELDAGSFNTYHWSNGAITYNTTISTSGTFRVTVTDANGCTGTASQIVTVNSNPIPIITPDGPTTFCDGSNVTLDAGNFATYLWNSGESTQSISVSASNTFCVSATNNNGCMGTVCIDVINTPTCNGTPSNGVATNNLVTSCGTGQSATLNLINSIECGVTLQWQSSADSIAWTDISGATTVSISTSPITTTTFFRCVKTCSITGLSSNSNLVYVLYFPTCYCIPSYANACGNSGIYINNFSTTGADLNITNNNSGCNGTIGNYIINNLSMTARQGSSFYINMQSANTVEEGFGIWIDYNQNGSFEDTGEFVYASPGFGGGIFTGMITIPVHAQTGTTLMRVRSHYQSSMTYDQSCSVLDDGEAEDYLVNITVAPILPDLQITSVSVPNTNLAAGDSFAYQISVFNGGLATAPSGVRVRGFLSLDNVIHFSSIVVSEDTIVGPLPVGQTSQISNTIKVPFNLGQYNLIYKVNPLSTFSELNYVNNTSQPVNVTISPGYSATAIVSQPYFLKATTIPITGNAQKHDNSPAANVAVEVYIITNNLRRKILVTTDNTGNYTTSFVPLSNESGHYIVGASFPGISSTEEQDNFDILGVRINGGTIPQFQFANRDTLTGTLSVENLSNNTLTNFNLAPVSLPIGATMVFDTIPVLAGGATLNIGYRISGTVLSQGNSFLIATFNAIADEGLIQPAKLFYYCQAQQGFISASIPRINSTVSSKDSVQIVEFYLANHGQASSGNIQISIPNVNWLNSVTQNSLPPINPGDSAHILLRFIGLTEVPFNFPITGSIGISAQNGNGFNLPFTFQKVSDTIGTVIVNAVNQYTFFTSGAPKVAGASVTISNYYTGVVYAQGLTDANGVFQVTGVPEGTHRIVVSKEKHLNYDNVITIIPGGVVTANAFLNYQAITFSWNVIPTTVQDTYNITLVMKFETNVPEPVVTIGIPDTLPQLFGTDIFPFNITLTNHGLITANDFVLNLPTDDPEYEFVTNYVPEDVPALSTIQVPVVMRRRPSGPSQLTERQTIISISKLLGIQVPLAAQAQNNCITDFATGLYTYECGGVSIITVPAIELIIGGRTDGGCVSSGNISDFFIPNIGGSNAITGTGNGHGDGGEVTTIGTNFSVNCNPCILGILTAAAGCIQNEFGSSVSDAQCVLCVTQVGSLANTIPCLILSCGGAIPGPVGCAFSVGVSIGGCINQVLVANSSLAPSAFHGTLTPSVSASFKQIADNLFVLDSVAQAFDNLSVECYGNMVHDDDWVDIRGILEPYISANDAIDSTTQLTILTALTGFQISPDTLISFIQRWNATIQARHDSVFVPNIQYPNIINKNVVDSDIAIIKSAKHYSDSLGFSSLFALRDSSIGNLNSLLNTQKNSVCASVTIEIKQQLTMTREAFDGTLSIFNGHPTDSMQNLTVNIQITGPNGVPSNDRFEIDTTSLINLGNITGTGSLASQQTGSVQFRFIPDSSAAPQVPVVYNFGGNISYFDPFVQAMVNMPLSPVPLTVNPSPSLLVHYFMERNIFGDDPLTAPIEPSIPAELGVMIENTGYGPAVNLSISSSQPEIVDNEKGLAVNFSLIGSKLQGKPATMGLTNIPFGIIPPLQTRIGEWYFTSSLLGKFVDYNATVTHNNSSGHPGMSLVQRVQLHELTHAIKVYSALDDTINDFLVNDFFNANQIPDHIYLSQGNDIFRVFPASSGSFSSFVNPPSFTNILTVAASDTGWNFIRLDDPGKGLYDIISVTREDGQSIPIENTWLTYVTLPFAQDPIYENKFQFVDTFPSLVPVNYTVVWTPKNLNVPEVDTITGAPTQLAVTPVQHLTVVFSKPIDSTTFTHDDLTLILQGGPNIMDSTVIITQLDSVTFDLDISSLTAVGNGFYILTVQAAGVKDIFDISGFVGKQTSWSQYINTPAVQAFQGLPNGNADSSFSTIQLLFNMAIDENTVTPQRFSIFKDSVLQAGTLAIDSFSTDKKVFYLSGLNNILTIDGQYELVVDMPNIQSVGHVFGIQSQSVTLTLDRTGPVVVNLITSNAGGIDSLHITYVNIQIDQDVFGFNTASVALSRNGIPLSLNINQLTWITPFSLWTAGNFGFLTYPDGNYVFKVFTTRIRDAVGNLGSDTQQVAWTVHRSSLINIATSSVPPSCNSTSDGVAKVNVTGGQLPYQILWSNGLVNDSIIVSPGTYSVTVTDAAGISATASITVTSNPPPTPVITGPLGICEGQPAVLDAGSFASYNWNTGETSFSITVNTTGTFSITVTDGNGCTGTASHVITVSPDFTANIRPSGAPTFCSGGSVTLDAGSFASYNWSTGETFSSIAVNATGTFDVTVTDANGCIGTASQVITVNPFPSPSIIPSGSTTFCDGGSVTLDLGTFTNYLWSGGETTNSIAVNASGSYTATVTDVNGCTGTASQDVTVNANPNPTITPSGSTTFCDGGSVTLDAGTFANYSWSNSSSSESINVSTNGTFTATVTDANGCIGRVSQAIIVNVNPTPNITPSGSTTFCQGGSVTLDAGNFSNYSWSNGGSSQTIIATNSGTFTTTVTDANGCIGSASQAIIVNTNPIPNITPSGSTTFCNGGSMTLDAGTYNHYSWNNGATSQNIITNSGGTFTATVTDLNGCTGIASQIIIVNANPSPVITPNGPVTFCQGGSVILNAGTFSSYSWSNGATSQTINATATGTFRASVTDVNGCSASASINVIVNPLPEPIISGPSSVCNGGQINLSTGTFTAYHWSTNATTASINITASGTYFVTVSNANGCNATASKNVTVSAFVTPTITANGNTQFCQGGSVTLGSSVIYNSYVWSNGATASSINVPSSGTYRVTVSNGNNCSGVAQRTVTVLANPNPTITVIGGLNYCLNSSNATLTVGAVFSYYHWSTGANTQSIIRPPGNPGTYNVTVTSTNGCTGTASTVLSSSCDIPTPQTTINITATTALANWIQATCGSGFTIRISKHNLNNFVTYTVSSPNSHYTFSALTHNTTYDWQVRNDCGNGSSAFCALQTFTTIPRLEEDLSTVFDQTFSVFPNPAKSNATVKFYAKKVIAFKISIIDFTGRIVLDVNRISVEGDNQYELDLSKISRGIYLVTLTKYDAILQRKLVVQ